MKINAASEEELDKLPKFIGNIDDGFKAEHRHGRWQAFPYKRVRRYLRSRVGRNWTRVVREFVRLDWVPVEFRTHLQLTKFVETHTFIEKGRIFYFDGHKYHTSELALDEVNHEVFYVHPDTNKLVFKPAKKVVKRKSEPETFRVLGPFHQLINLNGIWYDVQFKNKLAPSEMEELDELTGHASKSPLLSDNSDSLYFWTGGLPYFHQLVKRQLNSKELKEYGLKNKI